MTFEHIAHLIALICGVCDLFILSFMLMAVYFLERSIYFRRFLVSGYLFVWICYLFLRLNFCFLKRHTDLHCGFTWPTLRCTIPLRFVANVDYLVGIDIAW